MPSRCGLHRLPDVDVGVADDQHVRARLGTGRRGRPGHSLLPGTRWSTSTPEPARRGPGAKSRTAPGRSSTPSSILDHHALDPQVVTPDLLDQLGVVPALDEDPGPARDPGPLPGPGAATDRRRRSARAAAGRPARGGDRA